MLRPGDEEAGVCFYLKNEAKPAPMTCDNLAAYIVHELERQARDMLSLAAEIEDVFGKGVQQ
jgi:hypothetical protein